MSKVNELKEVLDDLDPNLRKDCLEVYMRKEKLLLPNEVDTIFSSIKEVICEKRSRTKQSDGIWSTQISVAGGPDAKKDSLNSVWKLGGDSL